MKHLPVIALASSLILAACSTPQVQTGDDAEVVLGKLHKVDNARADMVYIDPAADFARYRKVLITPLGLDNVEVIQPSSNNTSITQRRNWELTERDKQQLQAAFHDAMVTQLADKGSFPVVDQPGDDVLQISAALTAIAPSAAKDDSKSRSTGRSLVYTEGAGTLAVFVVYGDSETQEVLALAKDRRASQSNWGVNNSVTNAADVRRIFNSWAAQINRGLEKLTMTPAQ